MDTPDTSTKQSDLSRYGYDMVIAVTQGSLNATLKRFLDSLDTQPQVACWRGIPNSQSVVYQEADYAEIKKKLGKDLFDISDNPEERTKEDNEVLDAAYNQEFFAFAFKYQFGYVPEYAGQIIELADRDGSYEKQKVCYNLHFKEFQIIDLNESHKRLLFKNIRQPEGKPFVFRSRVNLSMENVRKSDLPPDIKEKIYHIGGDMFSVQQLFLDVNSVRLQSLPEIEGVEPDTLKKLVGDFYQNCWLQMSRSGKIIFHYVVKGDRKNKMSSFQPTAYDFCISPFSNRDEKKLYTLNYIAMTNNRSLPETIREMEWNWIEKYEYETVHGAVAINKNSILPTITSLFRREISKLLLEPSVHITSFINKFRFDSLKCTQTDFPETQYEQEGHSWRLRFRMEAVDYGYVGPNQTALTDVPDTGAPGSDGPVNEKKVSEAHLTYSLESEFTLENNKITHTVDMSAYLTAWQRWWAKDRVGKGKVYSYKSKICYFLSAEPDGEIQITPRIGWEERCGNQFEGDDVFEKLTENVSFLTDNLNGALNAYTKEFASHLRASLQEIGQVWILPGHETFLFKDVAFADSLDLTAHLTYKNNF